MRRYRCLFPVLLGILYSPLIQAQQSGSGILSSSRAINWTHAGLPATLPDGETISNPWTPPTRSACTTAQAGTTVPIPSSASVSTINSALTSCASANPNGSYLLLGTGTFTLSSTTVTGVSNVTLRGSGPMSTILSLSGSGEVQLGVASTLSYCSLTSGSNYAQGSTTITCNSLSGTAPVAGDIGYVVQCDTGYSGGSWKTSAPYYGAWACTTGSYSDNGAIFVCSYNTICSQQATTGNTNAYETQEFYISAVSSGSGIYTITVTPGLLAGNWAYAQTPGFVILSPPNSVAGFGLEDMTIAGPSTGTTTSAQLITMSGCYACWEKGLRVIGSGGYYISTITNSLQDLVLNSYFWGDPASDSNYPPSIVPSNTTNVLYLNNMMFADSEPIEDYGGNMGAVEAYNFARDTFTGYPFNTSYNHHGFDAFNLFEGNQYGEYTEDDTWATHALDTYFRNLGLCSDVPYTTYGDSNSRAYQQDNYQRFMNVIGNAWGSSQCTNYQSASTAAYIYQIYTGDALSVASLMRWGNVSTVTESSDTPANSGIRFVSSEVPNSTEMPSGTYPNAVTWQNSTPANDNLPCSFYFSGYSSSPCSIKTSGGTGFNWWKVCRSWATFPTSCSTTQTQPFPIAGPDQNGGPYVNGHGYDVPAAIAWQNLPIDTTYQHSYTITGSSYSDGIETLSISGLPNVTHLMGPFQFSGAPTACSNGATFGANSEILMTGSSSTTVEYALALNPDATCTGKMLFPDVREFDERVYETDSTAGLAPATGLNGKVVTTP